MFKRFLLSGIIVLFIAACGNDENNSAPPNDTTELKPAERTELTLNSFDSLAGKYVGKEVTVSGIVDHVCKKGGKKFLLVDGDFNLHVFNDDRFDESLSGSKVTVNGIVQEERIDSTYLAEKLKHEQETHADGNEADKENLVLMEKYVRKMQDSLKKSGLNHFSNYSLKFVSLKEDKENKQ